MPYQLATKIFLHSRFKFQDFSPHYSKLLFLRRLYYSITTFTDSPVSKRYRKKGQKGMSEYFDSVEVTTGENVEDLREKGEIVSEKGSEVSMEGSKEKKLTKHQIKLEQKKLEKQQQQNSSKRKAAEKSQKQILAIKSQLNSFHQCYDVQYGRERWYEQLFPALIKPTKYVALVNKYIKVPTFAERLLQIDQQFTVPFLTQYFNNVYIHSSDLIETTGSEDTEKQHWPTPGISTSLDPDTGLCCYYPLDAASLFPVLLLDAKPYHRVLDMCSAPGGKALAILQSLELHTFVSSSSLSRHGIGSLTCNDVSHDRKLRLQNVIRRYIPKEISESYGINVTNFDMTNSSLLKNYFGAAASNEQNVGRFDRILLDAPCSSERHLLQEFYADFPSFANDPQETSSEDTSLTALPAKATGNALNNYELLQWSIGRNRSNAERQFQLLTNAIKLLHISGRIVYSTCSIHACENDELVQRAIQKVNKYQHKNGYKVEIIPIDEIINSLNGDNPSSALGEKTECGWQILPDRSLGFGPIYLSVLTKTACPITDLISK